VQWLFLHKKLNHWSSTRSTAEVLYALAHYLRQENQLGVREDATVKVGAETQSFVFEARRLHGQGDAGRDPRVARGRRPVLFSRGGEDHARDALRVRDLALRHRSFAGRRGRGPLRRVAELLPPPRIGPGRGPSYRSRKARPWPRATRSRSSSRCARSRRPSTSTCATHVAPASSRSRSSPVSSGRRAWASTKRCGTAARTSSSNGSPRASTRSAIGSGPPPRAASAWARRRCSPCTRPSSRPFGGDRSGGER